MKTPEPTGPRKITAPPVDWISCHTLLPRTYSNRYTLGNPFTGSIESGWCLYHMVGSCWNQATKAAFPPEPGMKPEYIDGAWRWVQPTAPATPPPAGTETATPETDDAWETHNRGKCGLHYIAHKMRRLERERDQARRERDALVADNLALKGANAGLTATFATWQEDAKILAQEFPGVDWFQCRDFVPHVRALRHTLAATEALLEKRTVALEPFAKFACDEPHVNEPACHNCVAREALAATPEQALKEKEGAS